MLMKYSPNWRIFMDRLDREYPQWGTTMLLPFPDDYAPQESLYRSRSKARLTD
jgi:hypothetical protein